MTNIVKGYPHKPVSPAVAAVVRGFKDNPLLQRKHKLARQKSSKLRHDFSAAAQPAGDNNNVGDEESSNGN